MTLTLLQIVLYSLAAVVFGAVLGWLIRGARDARQIASISDDWQLKFDETARQRDRFHAENNKLRASYEAQLGVVHRHELAASRIRTELESAAEKTKSLNKQLFTVNAERDDLQRKLDEKHGELATANYQVGELESEFKKAGRFYKGELEKAFEKRKVLEAKVDDAKAEQESLNNLLAAARAESESVNKMHAATQARLDNIDAMEQKVIELEAENAQLRHNASDAAQEIASLQRDVDELNELKVQNRELAHCLQSMEESRRQYEKDAARYREKADQSDKRSETLRMKLDDVEQSFTEIAKQHDRALEVASNPPPPSEKNGADKIDIEIDDLTKIIGIGKVFQQTLHDLGVYSYRQLANFGPSDIARVNMELKEFKGRMEQDDWIGQAKELLFQKYGETH